MLSRLVWLGPLGRRMLRCGWLGPLARRMLTFVLALSLGLAWLHMPGVAVASASAPGDERYSITVLPQMELLVAVQTQTTWMRLTGPRNSIGNDYHQAVLEFMKPYKDHRAVKVCQELLDYGFTYDAPAAFALHLGPLPDLDLVAEYSEYLVGRAAGREKLEEFRLALKELAQESDFLGFLNDWRPKHEEWIAKIKGSTDPAKVAGWWEEFTGLSAGDAYHIVLCPATFYNNYGPSVYYPDNDIRISYNVAAAIDSVGEPSFGSPGSLEKLSLHEIGHSFVNPTFEPLESELVSIYPLYQSVERDMRKMAYTSVGTFLNEQVIRAVQAIAEGEFYGPDSRERSIRRDESLGFDKTSFVVAQLEDYAANRDDYPTFSDFAPVLLERLAQEAQKVEAGKRTLLLVGWLGAAALLIVLLTVTSLRRRPSDESVADELIE